MFRIPTLSSKHQDSFLALSREEEHLRQNLQVLIDAQSDGLLSGLSQASGQDVEETMSTGSRTPTSKSNSVPRDYPSSVNNVTSSRITIPIRQPTRQKIGLHGARRGITRAISDLARLKSQEENLLEEELAEKASELATVHTLGQKRAGLEGRVRSIEEDPNANGKISKMQREEKALDVEIKELETRLWGMKTRHRHLVEEIQGLENRVQSQLSSYKAALRLAERETREFLSRPPARMPALNTQKEGRSGIWALPPDRRTLEMADEQFRDEQQAVRERLDEAETERKALEEGVVSWEDVVRQVTNVETMLRAEMQRLPPGSSSSSRPRRERNASHDNNAASADAGDDGARSPEQGMHIILQELRRARSRLETHVSAAEARGWKLLVCCIGAELEALGEGYEVLSAALGGSASSIGGDDADTDALADEDVYHDLDPDDDDDDDDGAGGDGEHDGQGQGRGREQRQRQRQRGSVAERSEDEDEGPGPELLVSHLEE